MPLAPNRQFSYPTDSSLVQWLRAGLALQPGGRTRLNPMVRFPFTGFLPRPLPLLCSPFLDLLEKWPASLPESRTCRLQWYLSQPSGACRRPLACEDIVVLGPWMPGGGHSGQFVSHLPVHTVSHRSWEREDWKDKDLAGGSWRY